MIQPRRHFSLWYALLGCLGLVTAHSLSYVLAAPDAHVHADLLARTGHGSRWWIVAVAISVVMGAAMRSLRFPASAAGSGLRSTFLRLAPFQVIAFVLLEAIERFGTDSLASFAGDPVLWLGTVVQVLVAFAAAALLYVAVRVSRFRTRVIETGAAAPSFDLPPAPITPRPSLAARAWNLRGPPVLLAHI